MPASAALKNKSVCVVALQWEGEHYARTETVPVRLYEPKCISNDKKRNVAALSWLKDGVRLAFHCFTVCKFYLLAVCLFLQLSSVIDQFWQNTATSDIPIAP